jgi:FMN reductase
MSDTAQTSDRVRVVAISAGMSDSSSTRMLVDRLLAALHTQAKESGRELSAQVVELRPLAAELAQTVTSGLVGPRVQDALDALAGADAVIAATPVYRAGVSGLFKMFFDVIEGDVLLAMPVALLATAGTPRHALVVDDQMRALFAYFRALSVPTSLFAGGPDWGSASLSTRTERVAAELLALAESRVRPRILGTAGAHYRHTFDGAADAAGTPGSLDLGSDLMRLATGGSLDPE